MLRAAGNKAVIAWRPLSAGPANKNVPNPLLAKRLLSKPKRV